MRSLEGPKMLRLTSLIVIALLAIASTVDAAEPVALVKARAAYNSGDYDAAIEFASEARKQPEWADMAALVMARAYFERYRRRSDPADLAAGLGALVAVRASALPPREHVDLLVGLGQYLFLTEAFGASAELFDSALAQSYLLNGQERLSLLDWWANALDRSAQARPADRRAREFDRLIVRMEEEVDRDPANPVANYWLAAGARGAGDVERAWDYAVAAWVRSGLWPEAAPKVREDLDRLVVQVIVPERVRARGAREPQEAAKALLDEWATIKEQWSTPPPTPR
jgi:hypothetical protein